MKTGEENGGNRREDGNGRKIAKRQEEKEYRQDKQNKI